MHTCNLYCVRVYLGCLQTVQRLRPGNRLHCHDKKQGDLKVKSILCKGITSTSKTESALVCGADDKLTNQRHPPGIHNCPLRPAQFEGSQHTQRVHVCTPTPTLSPPLTHTHTHTHKP
eukprot:1161702-Pelagomonas_calceolata.AAC.1